MRWVLADTMVNRVKELEQQVSMLEATVNGLIEELGDTKARLNHLEEEVLEDTVAKPESRLDAETGEITEKLSKKAKSKDDTPDIDDDIVVV